MKGFNGYKRADGSVGLRNYVVVISSVICANKTVSAIGREVPGVRVITHSKGCSRGGPDIHITLRTLSGLARNPNVAGVLIVGLGCEMINIPQLVEDIGSGNKPVEYLIIQEQGGSRKTTARGIDIVRRMADQVSSFKREEFGWDSLIIGLECGGSDALSGITANPLVGRAADWLVEKGGTAILSESTEMIGTEEILSARAANPETAQKINEMIMKRRQQARDILGIQADNVISLGNMEGGLSNIIEKSLGCIIKGGNSGINEVIDYALSPSKKGLVIMDTPGADVISVTGMAAGGAQMILFTTGRGTPVGFPIAPVIKIASSTELFERMNDDMDMNAGSLLEGGSMDDTAVELVELIKRVADGEETKAEINNQDCLDINIIGPAF